jgi:myo-inositol 2-dehydrogenase / D-chiro-inositol 1-dehydrogenase
MSSARLRVGVIGTGWIGQTHIQSLAGSSEAVVAATADPAVDGADYPDWRALLEHEVLDAVLICTPPDTHREPAIAAAARGLPFYLEKPVAHTLADADVIADAASRVICGVGYQYRAISFLDRLPEDPRALIGTGVSQTRARRWFGDTARGGSIFLERASHLIDLQRRLAGEVTQVAACAGQGTVAMNLGFASGAVGTVAVGNLPGPGWSLELAGAWDPVRVELDPHWQAGPLCHEGPPPIVRSLRCFLEAVRRDDRAGVLCSVAEGVCTLGVALAAQQAAQTGRVTFLAESARRSSAASAAGTLSGTGTPRA